MSATSEDSALTGPVKSRDLLKVPRPFLPRDVSLAYSSGVGIARSLMRIHLGAKKHVLSALWRRPRAPEKGDGKPAACLSFGVDSATNATLRHIVVSRVPEQSRARCRIFRLLSQNFFT